MQRLSSICLAVLALLCSLSAQVVPSPGSGSPGSPTSVITGQIQTATGGTINNGTLTFTLSQPAMVSGSALIAPQTVSCYTSTQGNVVGLPDPLALPVVTTNTASGTLSSGTYYVKIYYFNASAAVSAPSPETVVTLTSNGSLIINAPLLQPSAATGYGVAISATSGAETIQGTVTGFTQFTQSTPLIAGATPAATNNSVCNIYFSDQLVPTGTYYSVNLVNKNASVIAGFPQSWCTYGGAGATINVAQGAPTGNCNVNGVFYPTPIFANPGNAISQSVNSTLSLPQGIIGPLNISGVVSFTGTVNACNQNGVVFVGGGCATYWAPFGSDIGVQINNAYAALPSTGGIIVIETGSYSFSTSIVFAVNGKPVQLQGQGVQATLLTYTGTGTAITMDPGPTLFSSGVYDFRLVGPGAATSSIGIAWGSATNQGCIQCRMTRVEVNAFGTGTTLEFSNVFHWVGDQATIYNNGQNLLSNVGMENNKCFGCVFALDTPGTTGTTANSVQITNNADWSFYGCAFDNVQLVVSNNASVRVFGGHFEDPAGTNYDFFTSAGNTLEFHGVHFLSHVGSAGVHFGTISGGTFSIFGSSAFAGSTFAEFVLFTGGSGSNFGLTLNSTFTNGWASGSVPMTAVNPDQAGDILASGTGQAQIVRFTNQLSVGTSGPLLCSASAPTLSSGFNSGTVSVSNGTCAFAITIGTTGSGNNGVISLPTASHGWSCPGPYNITHPGAIIMETANSTNSATITNYGTTPGTPANWTNSDVIGLTCFAD